MVTDPGRNPVQTAQAPVPSNTTYLFWRLHFPRLFFAVVTSLYSLVPKPEATVP